MRKRNVTLLIMLLVIGFASVSTTLIINGVIGIASNESDFDVIFTSARLDGRKRNDLIGETKKTINFETNKLINLDEEAVLDYEVTNASRIYDANVIISCNFVDEEDNVIEGNDYIVIGYEPKTMTVNAGKTESGSITAKLIKTSTHEQSIKIKCTLNANATEREELGEEYIVDKGLMIPVNYSNEDYTTHDLFWDYKESIAHVVFEDKVNDRTNAAYTFDVSQNQDESVMSYLVEESTDNMKYTLYIQSEGSVVLNPKSDRFFLDFSSLEDIVGLDRVDTSNVITMKSFFYGCSNLKSLDLSKFDTSNVIDMHWMFSGCSSLTTLDLSFFDTSLVKDMSRMFKGCSSLTSLDLSNFDTSQVTEMYSMFENCGSLLELDLNHFDTSNVSLIYRMFYDCVNLINLNIDKWNTSEVVNMGNMFNGCRSLVLLDISNFDTSKVKYIDSMFNKCSSLTSLDLSNFNTSNVENMEHIFHDCVSLTHLDIRNFTFENVTTALNMFYAMPNNAVVVVRDASTQSKVLNSLPTINPYPVRPAAWTTDNVIVA